jgi:thiol-disulfide isomerase/thioredoxin
MMLNATLARLVLTAGVIGVLLAGYRLLTRVVLARALRGARSIERFTPGTPGVVFFTTPDCMTCKAAQVPALAALNERLGGRVQVIEVDALGDAALAKRWSVLSVPMTFILDRTGRPRHVNHGFASTEKLFAQIAPLAQI